jgi:hypothetical protein
MEKNLILADNQLTRKVKPGTELMQFGCIVSNSQYAAGLNQMMFSILEFFDGHPQYNLLYHTDE